MRAALIAGALLSSLAGPVFAGDQFPFRGNLAGTATMTPLGGPIVAVEIDATGTATQLGKFKLEAPHIVDQSTLTGEPIPVDRGPGEPVYTGTVNQFGIIEVKAEKVGHATTLGQVLKMVVEAQQRKAPLERAADRLARYFLPVVEVVAGLTSWPCRSSCCRCRDW